jgi:hypothetical protein
VVCRFNTIVRLSMEYASIHLSNNVLSRYEMVARLSGREAKQ